MRLDFGKKHVLILPVLENVMTIFPFLETVYSWLLFHYYCEKAVTHKKTHILGIRYTCSVENLPFEAQTKNVQDICPY